MVMPRFSSSLCRDAQTPVKACTKVVLPWSTCPMVPMFTSGCLGKALLSLLILFFSTNIYELVKD
jgi:hypothetical protein